MPSYLLPPTNNKAEKLTAKVGAIFLFVVVADAIASSSSAEIPALCLPKTAIQLGTAEMFVKGA